MPTSQQLAKTDIYRLCRYMSTPLLDLRNGAAAGQIVKIIVLLTLIELICQDHASARNCTITKLALTTSTS